MDHDIKKDMIHQYLKYFKVWFIAFAVVLVLTIITFIGNLEVKSNDRNNDQAPIERVYDYANVLSDTEEQQLRDLIAIKEIEIECDIVLVTINQEVGIDRKSFV